MKEMMTKDYKKLKRNFKNALNRKREKLVKMAREKGIWENFGQKEVMELEDKYIDTSDYSNDMNEIRRILQNFNEELMFFSDKNLK